MPGAIHAKIIAARRASEREELGRSATVRPRQCEPADVVIADISRDGCRLDSTVQLCADDIVTIGLPGLGVRSGRVSWSLDGQSGVAFGTRLSKMEIAFVRDAQTVIEGRFPDCGMPQNSSRMPSRLRLSRISRFLIILATALVSWSLVILTGQQFLHR
jgi:hypothetical protein